MDILDHYTLTNNEESHLGPFSIEQARELAAGDERRIWFVRDSDDTCYCGSGCEPDAFSTYECECDPEWSVEPWHGQFVNCLGFFVTTEPRKPEHDDAIFTY